jgi:phenylpropionate dioxygenase-like ring-hydroxylating dioxygenase large terminal subunit
MTEKFLKNCWYVAAWDHEVTEAPLARTVLCEPVVLYRTENGAAVALEDRCCHRALPLSMGKVVGDRLQCGYHGLEFDSGGACVKVPGQTHIPPGAAVRRYPTVERWKYIWIWMGDPDLADETLIPNWWWFDHPDWEVVKGKYLRLDCNYELITDNLLDLSHLSYVHLQTLGTTDITEFPIKTERENDMIRMTRWIIDRPAPPMFQKLGKFSGTVDRWQIVETFSPCHTQIMAGAIDTGTIDQADGEPNSGMHIRSLNAPTPETETSTFYFFGHARDFALGDQQVSADLFKMVSQTFDEDVVILEAQQKMLDRDPGRPLMDINVDAPGLAARQMLRRDIAAERG